MDIEKAVRSLAMPLPEDILKRKWAGDFAGAIAAIDLRLQEQLPEMLAWRLPGGAGASAPHAHPVPLESRPGL